MVPGAGRALAGAVSRLGLRLVTHKSINSVNVVTLSTSKSIALCKDLGENEGV